MVLSHPMTPARICSFITRRSRRPAMPVLSKARGSSSRSHRAKKAHVRPTSLLLNPEQQAGKTNGLRKIRSPFHFDGISLRNCRREQIRVCLAGQSCLMSCFSPQGRLSRYTIYAMRDTSNERRIGHGPLSNFLADSMFFTPEKQDFPNNFMILKSRYIYDVGVIEWGEDFHIIFCVAFNLIGQADNKIYLTTYTLNQIS